MLRPFRSHHNCTLIWNGSSDCLVWQNSGSIDVQFIRNSDVLAQHSNVLNANLVLLVNKATWIQQNLNKSELKLTHFPMMDFQPMMERSIQLLAPTRTPSSNTVFLRRTPSSTTQLGPITTLGPIRQSLPILADGSYIVVSEMIAGV